MAQCNAVQQIQGLASPQKVLLHGVATKDARGSSQPRPLRALHLLIWQGTPTRANPNFNPPMAIFQTGKAIAISSKPLDVPVV